jgi:RNA polymerase primary sigma factor
MEDSDTAREHRDLLRGVLAGDAAAAEDFFRVTADVLWSLCRRIARDHAQALEAFDTVCQGLAENGFERLRAYDGRSRLTTFVALLCRDLLAQRLMQLLREDAETGWGAFEAFFRADLERLIRRRLPGSAHAETRREAWQEICAGLLAEECRRLRSFTGAGSLIGFVLHTADRLLLDFIRTFSMRRRMPAAVARLPVLEQEIFRCVYWQCAAADAEGLSRVLVDRVHPAPGLEMVAAALENVRGALPAGYAAGSATNRFVSLSHAPDLAEGQTSADAQSPEDHLVGMEEEQLLSAAVAVLRKVAATLPRAERDYVRITLAGVEPLPAREVARLMQRPVEDIYKLKQSVLRRLREAIADHAEVRKWRASV